MSFLEIVDRARSYLQKQQRISLRALRREFDLDKEALEDLIEELVDVQQVAAREGKILSWVGPAVPGTPAEPPVVTVPSAEIAATPQADLGERRQLTVMFCDLVDKCPF